MEQKVRIIKKSEVEVPWDISLSRNVLPQQIVNVWHLVRRNILHFGVFFCYIAEYNPECKENEHERELLVLFLYQVNPNQKGTENNH